MGNAELAVIPINEDYNREKIELIKRTIAQGATDDELQLFLYTARRTGLDPLAKQIHMVKRWNAKAGREVASIQTGIDGYRLIADRTGKLAGISDALYDDESGPHPNKATVTVKKVVDGAVQEFTASARWTEYVQVNKEQKPTQMWAKMPYLMLGKCAEALALRKAFPADLSGVYTAEEMGQAENPTIQTVPVRSMPNDEFMGHMKAIDAADTEQGLRSAFRDAYTSAERLGDKDSREAFISAYNQRKQDLAKALVSFEVAE